MFSWIKWSLSDKQANKIQITNNQVQTLSILLEWINWSDYNFFGEFEVYIYFNTVHVDGPEEVMWWVNEIDL